MWVSYMRLTPPPLVTIISNKGKGKVGDTNNLEQRQSASGLSSRVHGEEGNLELTQIAQNLQQPAEMTHSLEAHQGDNLQTGNMQEDQIATSADPMRIVTRSDTEAEAEKMLNPHGEVGTGKPSDTVEALTTSGFLDNMDVAGFKMGCGDTSANSSSAKGKNAKKQNSSWSRRKRNATGVLGRAHPRRPYNIQRNIDLNLSVGSLISSLGRWRENRVRELFPPADAEQILQMPLGTVADKHIWAYIEHGADTLDNLEHMEEQECDNHHWQIGGRRNDNSTIFRGGRVVDKT
ncbi:unnamed protein product [Thlaspi arvense]|uniref:Uncharacterized protein n=1 Tax=Thlaspi arvense TaxID=13288 RepID=A0AAU9RR88_THLAR|nr:unnamed protein product [Thlaspi arvense]